MRRDHEGDIRMWRGFMESIARDVRDISTVMAEVFVPGPGGHPFHISGCSGTQNRLNFKYSDCAQLLRDGEPSIEVLTSTVRGSLSLPITCIRARSALSASGCAEFCAGPGRHA